MDDKTPPNETETMTMRGLPTWAADAIRARASKANIGFSAMARIILTDWALENPAAQPATATPEISQ